MAKFVWIALLRASSIFFPILLLKLALDGLPSDAAVGVQIVYAVISCAGIPIIFLLLNVIANLIGYNHKR